MIAVIVLICSAWFFAVDVSEIWFKHDKVPRAIGGWTHDGPYTTKAQCEAGRVERAAHAYSGESHRQFYKPHACRLVDYDTLLREFRSSQWPPK